MVWCSMPRCGVSATPIFSSANGYGPIVSSKNSSIGANSANRPSALAMLPFRYQKRSGMVLPKRDLYSACNSSYGPIFKAIA